MENAIQRIPTTFTLRTDVLEWLKEMAKHSKQSVDAFLEDTILDLAYDEPNEVTREAMREAEQGIYAGRLDVSSLKAMYRSLGL